MKKLLWALVVLCGVVSAAFASWSFDLESGYVSNSSNDIRIPGTTGTRFSLTQTLDVEARDYYRLRLTRSVGRGQYLSLLYAPLSLRAAGILPGAVNFNGELFPSGAHVDAVYRFDSYRATWYKQFRPGERFSYKLGFTAKIRDAAVRIKDAAHASETKNTGFVPLFHFGMTYNLTKKFGAVLDGDALAGGPGRAEDVLAALTYAVHDNCTLRLGYRIVEGGADTDAVYSFALLNYASAGITVHF